MASAHQLLRPGRVAAFSAFVLLTGLLAGVGVGPARGADATLDVSPETKTVDTTELLELEAALGTPRDVPTDIDFEALPDGNVDTPTVPDLGCTVPAGELSCAVAFSSASPGVFTIYSWVDEDGLDDTCEADRTSCATSDSEGVNEATTPGDDPEPDGTDVVVVTVEGPVVDLVDCTPENATPDVETRVEVRCRVFDEFDGAALGTIDIELLSGPNDLDGGREGPVDRDDCLPGAGECRFRLTSAELGTDVYCAWLDTDADDAISGAANDGGKCNEEAAGGEDRDLTDVIRITWGEAPPPPPPPPPPECPGFEGNPRPDKIGSPFDDVLIADAPNQIVCGLGGRDALQAHSDGNSVLVGGPGQDTLCARNGKKDRLNGGSGKDRGRLDGFDDRTSIEQDDSAKTCDEFFAPGRVIRGGR